MTGVDLKKIARKIEILKREVIELEKVSGGIQAIDRNADCVLASIEMLEINVSDIANITYSHLQKRA